MKEFLVDLIIDKTVAVQAKSIEEAKELAIAEICKSIKYSSLSIEDVIEVDEDGEDK